MFVDIDHCKQPVGLLGRRELRVHVPLRPSTRFLWPASSEEISTNAAAPANIRQRGQHSS
jgi:hypothetical protein